MFILLLLLLFSNMVFSENVTIEEDYPTVLRHGVLANKDNLNELKEMLEMNFNIKVYNLVLGNGDQYSLYTPMKTQLSDLCNLIYSSPFIFIRKPLLKRITYPSLSLLISSLSKSYPSPHVL